MSGDPYGYDHDGDGWLDGEDQGSFYGYDFDGDGDIDADDDFYGDMMMYEAGACFIATAVYGDYDHPRVKILREFRDQVLMRTPVGRKFVRWYYRVGPVLGKWIDARRYRKKAFQLLINGFSNICNGFLGK